jgi:hypothetical protein
MMNTLFSPLDVNYCNYFYFSSIFGFIIMTITSATMIFFLISKKRGNMLVLFQLIIQGFFVYFINRLLYSMCVNSLM